MLAALAWHYQGRALAPYIGQITKRLRLSVRLTPQSYSYYPTNVELCLSAEIAAIMRAYEGVGLADGERLRVPLAIGLFAKRAISLAKAARLAGLTRYEFAALLKKRGLPAYEYTAADYHEDLVFVASARE